MPHINGWKVLLPRGLPVLNRQDLAPEALHKGTGVSKLLVEALTKLVGLWLQFRGKEGPDLELVFGFSQRLQPGGPCFKAVPVPQLTQLKWHLEVNLQVVAEVIRHQGTP